MKIHIKTSIGCSNWLYFVASLFGSHRLVCSFSFFFVMSQRLSCFLNFLYFSLTLPPQWYTLSSILPKCQNLYVLNISQPNIRSILNRNDCSRTLHITLLFISLSTNFLFSSLQWHQISFFFNDSFIQWYSKHTFNFLYQKTIESDFLRIIKNWQSQ